MYNVSDYIAAFLAEVQCTNVHGLMGGGAAGLNDGFIRHPDINYLCYHHEQSAAYAALGEARMKERWGIVNPTTGCGGTNCYTPILNAWQDSIPLIAISGNVNCDTLSSTWREIYDINVRAYGVQENDIVSAVAPITKFAKLVKNADDIPEIITEAFYHAAIGRKGPSWIDVPADVQHKPIASILISQIPETVRELNLRINEAKLEHEESSKYEELAIKLSTSQRPLILLGGGVSNDTNEKNLVSSFILKHGIPTVATYAATNVISHDSPLYLGAIGIKGNRAANFALQNADMLVVLGSRLPYAVIGYDVNNFASHAEIYVVDIDKDELAKNSITFPNRLISIHGTAGAFCRAAMHYSYNVSKDWLNKCSATKYAWDIIVENKKHFDYNGLSIYHVMEELNSSYYDQCNFVVDAGSISYVAPTALKYKSDRSFIFSPAQADMGCALPSAIGVASSSNKRTICITGDGSLMSNLQELASINNNCNNLTIVVLNNGGYLSITNTQRNNYGENRVFGEHEGRGLSFPNYQKLCDVFNLKYNYVQALEDLSSLRNEANQFIEIDCIKLETIAPYQARINGHQAGAFDMAPFIHKDELISYASVPLKFVR